MQVVILAAGRGTRMKDLTDNVPKPMLQINGKPILAYKIEALPTEIEEIIFVVGYLGNQIQQYFGDSYAGKSIKYVQQDQLNGSGGALALAKELLQEEFLVMMGDDLYVKEDIAELTKHKLGVLGLEVNNPEQFGIIKLDQNGQLLEIVEKPKMEGPALANIGLYKLNKHFFDYPLVAIGKGEYGLPQTLALMAKENPVVVAKATDWFPIGNPENLEKAQQIIAKFL